MIKIINLKKTFFDKVLFKNVNLKFQEGNTYGVIGANGVGKTTFLNIIAGEIESTNGIIDILPNKRISKLSQNQNKYDFQIVTNVVIMGNRELYKLKKEKDQIYNNLQATSQDYERAAELEEKFGANGGWKAENDAQILLSGLGINKKNWFLKMSSLKSRDKVKVLLAQALFGNPDILIMDEPTNHLDLQSIKWLEKFLVDYKNIVIIVSHDSDFLDQVCTHIVDIDFGGAKLFVGNYTFWKQSSALALKLKNQTNIKKEEKKKKLQEFIARFSANASKSSQATSRKKALKKISLDEIIPSNRKYPYIRWSLNREPGKDQLKVENLSYKTTQGKYLFKNVSFIVSKLDKIAIIGLDDVAKTKFLEILYSKIQPTLGKVTWGKTLTCDYFPNDNSAFFKNKKNILEWISNWPLYNKQKENKDNSDLRMRNFLGRMLFNKESVWKNVQNISGGEKARLMFAKMMLTESNFLLLDQPLDHLDTESIDAIIDGIKNYKSSIIFTTYNRALIKATANVILDLKSDGIFFFRGNLEEYEEKMGY